VHGCQAELEQQSLKHKDIQQMLMSENEALQQQIIKLRHDLVCYLSLSHSYLLTLFTADEQMANMQLTCQISCHEKSSTADCITACFYFSLSFSICIIYFYYYLNLSLLKSRSLAVDFLVLNYRDVERMK